MPPRPLPRRAARLRTAVPALALVLAVVALPACGSLRWETAPPAAPVASAEEAARQRAAVDATRLADLAAHVLAAGDPALAGVATAIGTASREHLRALGGVHVPAPTVGPDGRVPSPTPTPTVDAPPPPAAGDVVTLLVETAASARADAVATVDGGLARLLASVSVSRLLLADTVAAAAGLPAPEGAATGYVVPGSVPPGVSPTDVAALIQSEDALGQAWEVVAARAEDDARVRAAARAATHRVRAEAWAVTGGVAATAADPRRSAYDLPTELTVASDPAVTTATLAGLEAVLVSTYASLLAAADAGSRSELADAMLDAARTETSLRGTAPVFPGAPDLAA